MACREKEQKRTKNNNKKKTKEKVETINKQTERVTLSKKLEARQNDDPRLCYKTWRCRCSDDLNSSIN